MGTANRHVGGRNACHHCQHHLVGGETAGSHDDAVFAEVFFEPLFALNFNSDNFTVLRVVEQFDRFGGVDDRNIKFFGFSQ